MNGEISEQTKTGKTKFYHRSGAHDDRLWAVALAVYAGRHDIVRYHPVAAVGPPNPLLEQEPWRRGGGQMVRPIRRGTPGKKIPRHRKGVHNQTRKTPQHAKHPSPTKAKKRK